NGPEGWRNCNLRTAFEGVIKRAGLEPWPRIFHNLRSSRETELLARFPPHVVAAWMGHDVKVSMRHYAQITAADFDRAASEGQSVAQSVALPGSENTEESCTHEQVGCEETAEIVASGSTEMSQAEVSSGEGGIRTRGGV